MNMVCSSLPLRAPCALSVQRDPDNTKMNLLCQDFGKLGKCLDNLWNSGSGQTLAGRQQPPYWQPAHAAKIVAARALALASSMSVELASTNVQFLEAPRKQECPRFASPP